MKVHTLLNVLKIAPKFLNMSKFYHNDNEFFSTIYLMNTGGKLEVRAGNGHSIFATALDCVETDAWKAPAILPIESIAKAITALRGLSKKTTCNVTATATGVKMTTSAGKSVTLNSIPDAEGVINIWGDLEGYFNNDATPFNSTIPSAGCYVPAEGLALAFMACAAFADCNRPILYRCRNKKKEIFWKVTAGETRVVVMSIKNETPGQQEQSA